MKVLIGLLIILCSMLGHEQPPECEGHGVEAGAFRYWPGNYKPMLYVEHGDVICYQFAVQGGTVGGCDATDVNGYLFLPDGTKFLVMEGADIKALEEFRCPGTDERCLDIGDSICDVDDEHGYVYVVNHDDEGQAPSGASLITMFIELGCPPNPNPCSGTWHDGDPHVNGVAIGTATKLTVLHDNVTCDFNYDGKVDLYDFAEFQKIFSGE